MSYNTACNPTTTKEPSQMDALLASLQEQVDRYDNSLHQIRSCRLTIQSEPPQDQEGKSLSPGAPFNDGILNRFHNLLSRFAGLNNLADQEVKHLQNYL